LNPKRNYAQQLKIVGMMAPGGVTIGVGERSSQLPVFGGRKRRGLGGWFREKPEPARMSQVRKGSGKQRKRKLLSNVVVDPFEDCKRDIRIARPLLTAALGMRFVWNRPQP